MSTAEPPSGADSQRLILRHRASGRRRWLKAAAFLFLLTLAGFVLGVACTVLYFRKAMHRVPPRPDAIAQAIVERLDKLVDLRGSEREELSLLVEGHMNDLDSLNRESFRNMREVFKRIDVDIEKVLGSERFEVWRKYKAMREAEWKRGRPSRHGDDNHPGKRRGS